MPSSHQLQAFNTALLDLYAPGLDTGSYVRRAFRLISNLVPSDLIGHGELDHSCKQLSASFDQHPPGLRASLEAFGQLMHKYEPFRFDPSVNSGRPYSARDFYTRSQFRDLDIYQEVHAPMGYDDHGFVHVPANSGVTVFFGVFRSGGIFHARDKEWLAIAQPHLANARRIAQAQTAAHDIPHHPALYSRCGFTPRQSEVIHWLTQGKTNLEIAQLLRVRTDTISGYLRTIYEKMGVENRVAATIWALARARQIHFRDQTRQNNPAPLVVPAA